MRVVVDTNVFISSFFGGNPRKIIELWKEGKIELCLSGPILDEYIEVLERLGLRGTEELRDLLDILAEGRHLIFASSVPAIELVADDPDDDKFIECAAALKAGYVVSGDEHLKSIGRYMGIRILSPRDFLSVWEAEEKG